MALHEGMEPKNFKEHPKRVPPHKMARKSGGKIDGKEAEDPDEEVKEEASEAEHEPRQRRKAGGAVHGGKPKHRPDKRARGGATSDMNPGTSAGNMSAPGFEHVGSKPDGGGKGNDKD